jgi:enoyl-CoA hydratase/carnithine racemase
MTGLSDQVWTLAAEVFGRRARGEIGPVSWLEALRGSGYGVGLVTEEQARERAREMAESIVRTVPQLAEALAGPAVDVDEQADEQVERHVRAANTLLRSLADHHAFVAGVRPRHP